MGKNLWWPIKYAVYGASGFGLIGLCLYALGLKESEYAFTAAAFSLCLFPLAIGFAFIASIIEKMFRDKNK